MLLKTKEGIGLLSILILLVFFPLARPTDLRIDPALATPLTAFPLSLGSWQGQDVELDERTYEILETRNVLSREYTNAEGAMIHLLLVGSHQDRRVAHPPEVCYLGSNYIILDKLELEMPLSQGSVKVRRFLAQQENNPNVRQHVLYVYKVGDRLTSSYYDQQLQFTLDRLTKKETEILLIRLSGAAQEPFPDFLESVLRELKARS